MPDDEFILDTATVRGFIAGVLATLGSGMVADALDRLRPTFAGLLADPGWLPERYQQPATNSSMGGGIASWLLFRAGDGGLSLFSLVVPPGAATPVHDHIWPGAWSACTRASKTKKSFDVQRMTGRRQRRSNWQRTISCDPAISMCSCRPRAISTACARHPPARR
jgi:predicted metal-dependent enzyme (double-stranded beta helix superfamily)